ncbi:MAG TPA: MmcQ/YjbR family DNA-binding protein [Ohtaekwangia sp.]|uniref:MmcQ/YjbR family DNA-binding protein n=1 Tax=Ohtaekwangia sp. TaxID=2066019 RepID=UPI002F937B6B
MTPESLRKFCLSLPAVTEDVKWGADLCFCIGEKMFCVTSLEGSFKLSFKVPDEDYEELSVREGFEPAPYMARNKWVLLSNPAKVKPKELESYIRQSYELIKSKLTKKLRKELGVE